MKTGIDVSAWQGQINWQQVRSNGAAFAFIKASKQLFSDQRFKQNWPGAKAAGLPRGAYHYLTWDVSPVSQARFFTSLIKTDPPELYPVVDFEETNGCPAGAAGLLKNFILEVAALGKASWFTHRRGSGCHTAVQTFSFQNVHCGSPTGG